MAFVRRSRRVEAAVNARNMFFVLIAAAIAERALGDWAGSRLGRRRGRASGKPARAAHHTRPRRDDPLGIDIGNDRWMIPIAAQGEQG